MPEIKQFACDYCGDVIPQADDHVVHGFIIDGAIYAATADGTGGLMGAAADSCNGERITTRSMYCTACFLDSLCVDENDVDDWLADRIQSRQTGDAAEDTEADNNISEGMDSWGSGEE